MHEAAVAAFSGSATVDTNLTTVFDSETALKARGAFDIATIDVTNTGTNLNALQLQIKGSSGGAWAALETAWTTVSAVLLSRSATIATLATGSAATVQVKLNGAYAFRIQASTASSTSVVTVNGVARG